MFNKKPIEDVFRNAFEEFEADVNPNLWTNIEHQLPVSSSASSANIIEKVIKKLSNGSSFSTGAISISSLLVVAVLAITYFSTRPDTTSVPAKTSSALSQKEDHPIDKPTENIINAAELKHENINNTAAQVSNKERKQIQNEDVNEVNHADRPSEGNTQITHNFTESSNVKPEQLKEEGISQIQTGTTQPENTDNIAKAADEKHENNSSATESNQEQILPLQQPVQNDNFDWGIIANSFSPNNDGINDVFTINNTEGLKSLNVTVLDRTGKTLYRWTTLDGSWNGTDLNGKELPAGFYLYYIFAQSVNGETHTKKGTLYLFR